MSTTRVHVAFAKVAAARLTRSPRAWLPIAAWCALVVALAALARSRAGGGVSGGALDQVLLGVWAQVALPFVAFGIVSAMVAGGGMKSAVRSLVGLGAAPARAAAVLVVVAAAMASGLAAVVGLVTVLVAGSAHIGADAFAATWVSAAGAAAYVGLFAFGATFGARGGGRAAALVIDWVVGAGASSIALVAPRAHLRSLLGGVAPHALPQRASTAALLALGLVFGLLAVRRTSR